jgi:hypothetical protein
MATKAKPKHSEFWEYVQVFNSTYISTYQGKIVGPLNTFERFNPFEVRFFRSQSSLELLRMVAMNQRQHKYWRRSVDARNKRVK